MQRRSSRAHQSIRWIVLGASLLLSFSWLSGDALSAPQRIAVTSERFALASLAALALTLAIGPALGQWPKLPGASLWHRARRALGVSTWLFALIHSVVSFGWQLHGWRGVQFLGLSDRLSLVAGAVALLILTALAATSFDAAVAWLGPRWYALHRSVYLAAALILGHAWWSGAHFAGDATVVSVVTEVVVIAIVTLHLVRVDERRTGSGASPSYPVTQAFLVILIALILASITGYGPQWLRHH